MFTVKKLWFNLNSSGYPEKYKFFVKELGMIKENITLGNGMINGANYKQTVDDELSCIIKNLRNLAKNLGFTVEI